MYSKIITIGSLTTLPLIWYYIKQRNKNNGKFYNSIKPTDRYYFKVIFSHMKNEHCKQHIFTRTSCGPNCAHNHLSLILNYIKSARNSISMCMYHLTLEVIAIELIEAHKRGVNVRVITDMVMCKLKANKSQFLKENGICVKSQKSDDNSVLMHHKFCLIDEKDEIEAKMFTGSLNLTMQGLTMNYEDELFTNHPDLLQEYSKRFNILWDDLYLI